MGSLIRCPSCHHEFELSAAVRAELEGEVRKKEAELLRQQRELAEKERRLQIDIELEAERRTTAEVARMRASEAKLAQQRTELQQEQQRLRDEEHRQQIEGLQ